MEGPQTLKSVKRLSLAVIAMAAAIGLASCGMSAQDESISPPVSDTDTGDATPAPDKPEPTPEPAPGLAEPQEPEVPDEIKEPEEPWQVFTDERIAYKFEVPADWSVEDDGGWPAEGIFAFVIYNEDGERKLEYRSIVHDTGETCQDDSLHMEVDELDVTPIKLSEDPSIDPSLGNLRFVYRIAHAAGLPYVGSLAVTSGSTDPGGSCVMSNVSTEAGPAMFADTLRINFVNPEHGYDRDFATREKAEEFMQTDDYQTLKKIITSLEFNEPADFEK